MTSSSPSKSLLRFTPMLLVLASAAISALVYLQALHYPFISDDHAYLVQNRKLAELSWTELWKLFTGLYNPLSEFLPLRELSYWLDLTMFGLEPSAFRMHNIVLYLLCLPLVYATTSQLWRYFKPNDAASAPWAAAAVTVLFALHPSHAEAVVWIAGRKDVLAGLFSLLALWLAASAKQERGLSAPLAAATLIAFSAAMLSKASTVAVAPVIALLWVIFWRDIPLPGRRRSMLLWPLAIMLLAACIATIFASIAERLPIYLGIEAATRSLAVLGWLARLTISSESRHLYYPVFEYPHLAAMVALGAAVLMAALIGLAMLIRKRSLESFALVAFFLLCLPSIQLLPYAPPSLVSDRFIFLAVWPTILLAVSLAWHLKQLPRTAFLLVIASTWSFQTLVRPHDWRNLETLINADARAYPGYFMPATFQITFFQLPREQYEAAEATANGITTPEVRDLMVKLIKVHHGGDADAATPGKLREATALLWEMGRELKQFPAPATWNSSLHNFWERMPFSLALEWRYLTDRFPDDVQLRYSAGLWNLDAKRYEDAINYLRAATNSQQLPESVRGTAFKSLGLALLNSGHSAEAEAPLRAALEQSPPDLQAYCLLSESYKQANRPGEAARAEASCHPQDRLG